MQSVQAPTDSCCIIETVTTLRQLESIKEKINIKKRLCGNIDLQPFQEFCCHENPHVTKITCDVIVDYVQQNKLSAIEASNWFISSLKTIKNIHVVITSIRDILLQSVYSSPSGVICPFGLIAPLHPFILILKENDIDWPLIDCQIQHMFRIGDQKNVFISLSPVFKYVLWSPPGRVNSGCKRSLWKLLVKNFNTNFADFITKTLWWLRIDEGNSILDVSYYLMDLYYLSGYADPRQEVNFISVLSAEIACKTAKLSSDPSLILLSLKQILKKYPETTDLVLMIIAESLPSCPVSSLSEFLNTCIELINSNGISNAVFVWMIIGALLPWMIHPLNVATPINEAARSLLSIVESRANVPQRKVSVGSLQSDLWFIESISNYTVSFWAFVIARTLESSSIHVLLEELSNFCVTSDVVQENFIVNVAITGIFLSSDNSQIQNTALDILMEKNAGFQLPLILFQLSRTSCPALLLKLLYFIPRTAIAEANIPPVLATIRAFSCSDEEVLVELSFSLYFSLWKTSRRCYRYLYDQLISYHSKMWNARRETYHKDLVISSIIRDICEIEPETHGKEWVKTLSDIILYYMDRCDHMPLIFALEAITRMCSSNNMDVLSVYDTLVRKHFLIDKRPEVIEQLCVLIGLIFQEVRETGVESDEIVVKEALSIVWKILAHQSERRIIEAALRALSKYSFEQMPLDVIPDEFRKYLIVPPKFVKNSRVDEDAKSLSFVPGTFWIEYLRNASEEFKPNICELLATWLVQEMKNSGRSLFHTTLRERESVSSFHDKSIFKVVFKNCKYLANKAKIGSIDEFDLKLGIFGLKILNVPACKSLPLFNWSFLDEFLRCHENELKKQVLTLWAKESVKSASAKSCIERYLEKLNIHSCSKSELELTFEIISNFCASVASKTIASFLSAVMSRILEMCKSEELDRRYYHSTCICLRKMLTCPDVDEHNCESICKNLVSWWTEIAIQSEFFDDFIDVAIRMPITYVDHLSSLSLSHQVSVGDLYKILKFRCSIALNDPINPFYWLNDCIEATKRKLQDRVLFFERTLEVFAKHRSNPSKWPWLLEFLDRQVSANVISTEICNFLCDTFIFAVVSSSTYYPFLEDATSLDECYNYFPQALYNSVADIESSKVIEWLSHSYKIEKISSHHKFLFGRSLTALRKDEYLQKLPVWCNVVQIM